MAEAASPPASVRAAPIRLVIFDFDGTLSDSGDWFLSVVDELAARFRFRTVEESEIAELRHRSTREVIKYLGIARWKLPFIARHVPQAGRPQRRADRPLPRHPPICSSGSPRPA
ncbi:MAG: HAD hydrolase-like protein [Sphingomonas sp.]